MHQLISRSPFARIATTLVVAILFLCLLGIDTPCAAQAAPDDKDNVVTPAMTIGPLRPDPVVTLYVVSDGEPTTARLAVRRLHRDGDERLLVRVFDPDENLTYWQYVEPDTSKVDGKSGDLVYDANLPIRGRGVNQVRIAAGRRLVTATLQFERELPWGVSFQNGKASGWPGQPGRMFVYVPPHAEQAKIAGGPIAIRDAAGKIVYEDDPKRAGSLRRQEPIPIENTETLWTVDLPEATDWSLRMTGFPFVLCPTAEAARAIRASVEVLDDGTVVCHKFQRRIHELLPSLLEPDKVGRAEDLIVPLATRREAWLENARRNDSLLSKWGTFTSIEDALRMQNVDPQSHWAGSMGGWKAFFDKEGLAGRWDRFRRIDALRYGLAGGRASGAAWNLAYAALLDKPFNPYHGKTELLYRAAASALADLQRLDESEVWPRTAHVDYPGNIAFPGPKVMGAYAQVAPHMPAEVRAVWTEGIRRLVDRTMTDYLVTARNQSSHHLVAYQDFAEASGLPRYRDVAKKFAQRFARGASPAGYHMESAGPCASYIGMTHWHEAVYAARTEDPVILDSLKRSYTLFNHTVAPEPKREDDSARTPRMLGGFNFNHRVGMGFYNEQYGGAKGIVDHLAPEVAVWNAWLRGSPEDQRARAVETINRQLDGDPDTTHSHLTTPRYTYWTGDPDPGDYTWPALEEDRFIREFGREFVFVNRPAYYAAIYVGRPAGSFYVRGREKVGYRTPLPDNAESTGGEARTKPVAPTNGGGLSLFWTREAGSLLLATNWSPLTHHGLVAFKADGTRYWEEYTKTDYTLSRRPAELTVTGQLEKHPVDYTRRYTFRNDKLAVMVTLKAAQAVTFDRLIETVPYLHGRVKDGKVALETIADNGNDNRMTGFTVTIDDKPKLKIVFDRPVKLNVVPDGLQFRGMQIGRVEIPLPSSLEAGQEAALGYTIEPVGE